ncbi:diaminopimelate decarboxylase [Brevundimonas variabilis]|uniref:Diaminopimelate decarboxylase n=1 Tax=Brevundimonas variabilis TaxID=74312 RepID=A0A7W9CGT0_9CAUL|nr:diaminopimelate decarboxylase [Brevundimonas variabilis]MBB5745143.1 diaminopimelate decarboxylase [Brevundimonas variabilis]
MNHFEPIDGILHAEEVSLIDLAETVGTPVYVYSTATLERHYRVLAEAVAANGKALGDVLIAFAVKANSNVSVLATLARLGCGADTVSEGEIRRALKAGIPASRIVFSGVGKTDGELAYALDVGVRQINVESPSELDRLIVVAERSAACPDIAIRVNPKVGAGGHAKITTGGEGDKFGIPVDEALALYARAASSHHVRPVGLACHIGSQITDLAPLEAAFVLLRQMTMTLREQGLEVSRLDLGGGLGVPYQGGAMTAAPADYVAMAARVLDGLDVDAVFEPGRLLAANAGILLSRVIQITERAADADGSGRRFLVLDAAMNDLIRPAMYDAFHEVVPVTPRSGEAVSYDIVGPVCETGDTFARDRTMPPVQPGDLVAFTGAGAYGAVMSSEYNTRPLVPEVLVRNADWAVVRPRPSYEDILDREATAGWLVKA